MTDADADYYVGVGLRDISSRLSENYFQAMSFTVTVATGEYKVLPADEESERWMGIETLFIKDPDESTWNELVFAKYEDLFDKYPKMTASDNGTPKYWTYAPKVDNPTNDTLESAVADQVNVWVMPPADETYSISIIGKRFHYTLLSATDVNYISLLFPEALIAAATQAYYDELGNQKMSRTWAETKERHIQNIDRNQVTLETQKGSGVMNG